MGFVYHVTASLSLSLLGRYAAHTLSLFASLLWTHTHAAKLHLRIQAQADPHTPMED